MDIKQTIQQKAYDLGITFCEFVPASIQFSQEKFNNWYSKGYAANMTWFAENQEKRLNPNLLFTEAKTIIVCGINYWQKQPERQGAIATYALGRDYHKVLGNKLRALSKYIEKLGGKSKCFVDTAPVFERLLGEIAGIGWQGSSSLLVSEKHGTYFFLGEIFTTLELECYINNKHENYCGTCRKCIESCPTGAIVSSGKVDANKCISYLTIENKGQISEEFRAKIGNRLYGCDECNKACPWNKNISETQEKDFAAREYPSAREILFLSNEEFSQIFAGSPIHRIKLEGLQRNACIVLGNIGNKEDVPALQNATKSESQIVREVAEWALKQL